MTEGEVPPVVLCEAGSETAPFIAALLANGLSVTVQEEDPETLDRVAFGLRRRLSAPLPDFGTGAQLPKGAIVIAGPAALDWLPVPPTALLAEPISGIADTACLDLSAFPLVEACWSRSDDIDRVMSSVLRASGAHIMEAAAGALFPGSQLLNRVFGMVDALLMGGAAPWELDAALEAAGWQPGPLAAQDDGGLDHALARWKAGGGARYTVLERMVQEGRLGRSVGVGWYRYPGGGGAVIDPLLEDMIDEEARFAGRQRAEVTADTIIHTFRMGVIAELVRIAEAGASPEALNRLVSAKLGPAVLPDLRRVAKEMDPTRIAFELGGLRQRFGPAWNVPDALYGDCAALEHLFRAP